MTRSQQRVSCFSIAAALVLMASLLVAPARGAALATGSPPRDVARPELQRLLEQVVAAGAPGVVALVNDGRSGWAGHGDEGWDRTVKSVGTAAGSGWAPVAWPICVRGGRCVRVTGSAWGA